MADVRQRSILACQRISLIRFDGNNALWVEHHDGSIHSLDDCHEFQEEMPPSDAVVPDVEAYNFKHQYLHAHIVSRYA
jgi:hypothetical protein